EALVAVLLREVAFERRRPFGGVELTQAVGGGGDASFGLVQLGPRLVELGADASGLAAETVGLARIAVPFRFDAAEPLLGPLERGPQRERRLLAGRRGARCAVRAEH